MGRKSVFLFTLLSLCSCGQIGMLMIGANRETVKLSVLQNSAKNKTVVFVPMTHIAKPVFYEDVKTKLDSLRAEGFVVFYESVKFDHQKYGPQELDTLNRKIRKFLGFYMTNYKDSTNASLPEIFSNDKYVLQTSSSIGLIDKDIKVDLPLDSIIKIYEKKFGEVQLEPCDFNTPLKAEYDCETLKSWDVVHTFRDDFIVEKLLGSPHEKIVMVYGKSHVRFLKGALLSKNGFVKIDK